VHGIEYERTSLFGVSTVSLKTFRRLFLAEISFASGEDICVGEGRSKGDKDILDRLLLVESSKQSDLLFRDSLFSDRRLKLLMLESSVKMK
jgi:hypothetical protein